MFVYLHVLLCLYICMYFYFEFSWPFVCTAIAKFFIVCKVSQKCEFEARLVICKFLIVCMHVCKYYLQAP